MFHIESPRTGDQATEQLIKAKGADKAPRVTPADIEANIVSEHYFTADDGVTGVSFKNKSAEVCPSSLKALPVLQSLQAPPVVTFLALSLLLLSWAGSHRSSGTVRFWVLSVHSLLVLPSFTQWASPGFLLHSVNWVTPTTSLQPSRLVSTPSFQVT